MKRERELERLWSARRLAWGTFRSYRDTLSAMRADANYQATNTPEKIVDERRDYIELAQAEITFIRAIDARAQVLRATLSERITALFEIETSLEPDGAWRAVVYGLRPDGGGVAAFGDTKEKTCMRVSHIAVQQFAEDWRDRDIEGHTQEAIDPND